MLPAYLQDSLWLTRAKQHIKRFFVYDILKLGKDCSSMTYRTRWPLWGAIVGVLALLLGGCGITTITSTSSSGPANGPTATATVPPPTIQVAQQSQSGQGATAAALSVMATCPTGTTLVSGGYTLKMGSATQLIMISADYPSSANTWTATELNPQSGGSVTLTTFADCVQAASAITASLVTANSDSTGAASAACPSGATLTGGGFNQTANGSNVIAASYPAANAWQTAQISGAQHTTYTAYAVCVSSGFASASFPTAGATIPNNTSSAASVTCPGGQILVGGGYREVAGATPIITDLHFGTMQTTWLAGALDQYVPPTSGPGGPPPAPNPLQLTTYGVCVSVA
jgi:hypothetical protein